MRRTVGRECSQRANCTATLSGAASKRMTTIRRMCPPYMGNRQFPRKTCQHLHLRPLRTARQVLTPHLLLAQHLRLASPTHMLPSPSRMSSQLLKWNPSWSRPKTAFLRTFIQRYSRPTHSQSLQRICRMSILLFQINGMAKRYSQSTACQTLTLILRTWQIHRRFLSPRGGILTRLWRPLGRSTSRKLMWTWIDPGSGRSGMSIPDTRSRCISRLHSNCSP